MAGWPQAVAVAVLLEVAPTQAAATRPEEAAPALVVAVRVEWEVVPEEVAAATDARQAMASATPMHRRRARRR